MKGSNRSQATLLLGVNGLFVLANALAGTFVNVYLWKSRQDFAMIGWFAVSQQIAVGLSFWLGGKWVKEHSKMNALRLGIAVAGFFYLLVLWLGAHAAAYVWPLGFTLGVSTGMFWLAFNTLYFEITDRANRDFFNGWMGLIGSFTGIAGPWVSGRMITWLQGERGYRMVFIVALCIYGLAAVLSFFLSKRKTGGAYLWGEPWRELRRKDSPWRTAAAALLFEGMREGVFSFLIGLLVYIATREESKLGQFALLTSAVSLVSYYLAGKYFKPRFRAAGMLAGGLLLVAVIVPLLWKVSYAMLLFMGLGTSLFLPLYVLPITSISFDLMGTDAASVDKRVELVVLRELSLMCGRLAGMFIFIIVLSVNDSRQVITLLLLGLGAAPLGSWLVLRRPLKAEKHN
ncbi:MFS transporter ['Paenibacillus yunnanensis' Narsing Rao et al. 2020]|uniref:MFS transporter n=1 Tax=Paenibacillus tengchongensis TaxID=2608684 RepID=UPI00124CF2B9|nr:MFS transporter [Paenibacillus tengchongensis]